MARPDLDPFLFVEYFGHWNFPHTMFLADQINDRGETWIKSLAHPASKSRTNIAPLSRGPEASEPGHQGLRL